MVNIDNRDFHTHITTFMRSVKDLLMFSNRMTVNTKDVGKIAIGLMVIDQEMDAYVRVGGEPAEGLWTDYYAAKAVAYGMAGKTKEGEKFLDKARTRRRGGVFDEWSQDYYKNHD